MFGIPYVGHVGPLIILAVMIIAVVIAVRQWVLPMVRRATRPDQPQ